MLEERVMDGFSFADMKKDLPQQGSTRVVPNHSADWDVSGKHLHDD